MTQHQSPDSPDHADLVDDEQQRAASGSAAQGVSPDADHADPTGVIEEARERSAESADDEQDELRPPGHADDDRL
ncbi:hypothetical protein [Nocardioides sp.]|uniref:hypothetical protein n=1 Tax=Nocardioides sp. TaxID=35761 RepID=UPI00351235D6